MALATRLHRLTPAEALIASTVNAAAAIGLTDRGALVPNARADFLVLQSADWRDLSYTPRCEPCPFCLVRGRFDRAGIIASMTRQSLRCGTERTGN